MRRFAAPTDCSNCRIPSRRRSALHDLWQAGRLRLENTLSVNPRPRPSFVGADCIGNAKPDGKPDRFDLIGRDGGRRVAPGVTNVGEHAATWASSSRQAKLGIAGAVGAPASPAPCDPNSTTRISVVGSSDCTAGLPASAERDPGFRSRHRCDSRRNCLCRSPDPATIGRSDAARAWWTSLPRRLEAQQIDRDRLEVVVGHVRGGMHDLLAHVARAPASRLAPVLR